jgi:prepilin-type N-terminal cleavage/methylation domain-containing protein
MHYIKLSNHRRFGFTLIEIMIVAAVIALLAAICVPGFLRARKRTQATRLLEDLRLLDHAIDQYAVENNKSAGMNPVFTDLKVYVKVNARLYNTGRDIFNRRYVRLRWTIIRWCQREHITRYPTWPIRTSGRLIIDAEPSSTTKRVSDDAGLFAFVTRE